MAEYPSAEVFELIAVFSRKAGTDYEKLAKAILTAPPQRNNNGCQKYPSGEVLITEGIYSLN